MIDMRALLALALLACTAEHETDVDAAIATDTAVDCATIDAPTDAGVDAGDPCWTHVHPMCNGELLDLCVPYEGCATYTCNGLQYGYCGPGGLDGGM